MRIATTEALRVVPFHEVRHFQPDDYLHFETIDVRGRLHDWTIPPHRHTGLHQIQYLAGGAVDAWIDDAHHRLAAPAVWMLAPGVVHRFAYQRGSSGQQVTIPSAALSQTLAATPGLAAGLAASRVLTTADIAGDLPECLQLLALIAREFGRSRNGRPEALAALAGLLAMWVLRHGIAEPPATRRQALRDALTHRFRSLIELHFLRHAPLTFYARELGVTPDHLSRICRATTGVSALGLLHARLLTQARRQLAYTDAGVASIALGLGFADPTYFSRFFTKAAGKSPSAYRTATAEGIDALP